MTTTKKPPVHRIRIGVVGVAIFENTNERGDKFYNAQFDRSFRSGDKWKHTRGFGRDDLLALAKLSDLTHTWIVEQGKASSEPVAAE